MLINNKFKLVEIYNQKGFQMGLASVQIVMPAKSMLKFHQLFQPTTASSRLKF